MLAYRVCFLACLLLLNTASAGEKRVADLVEKKLSACVGKSVADSAAIACVRAAVASRRTEVQRLLSAVESQSGDKVLVASTGDPLLDCDRREIARYRRVIGEPIGTLDAVMLETYCYEQLKTRATFLHRLLDAIP